MKFDDSLRNSIHSHLKQFEFTHAPDSLLKRAAVGLVIGDQGDGDAVLLLTRRQPKLRAHAGQFALPGGRIDPGETPAQAALREADEEIGLKLDEGMVLGRLDDYSTRSGYVMTPIVVWADDISKMQANPNEVVRIHRIHLGDLAHRNEPEFISIPESDRPVIRYPLFDTLIHAPTAAVIYQFVEVALMGRDTRVAHLEQPVWAWK